MIVAQYILSFDLSICHALLKPKLKVNVSKQHHIYIRHMKQNLSKHELCDNWNSKSIWVMHIELFNIINK